MQILLLLFHTNILHPINQKTILDLCSDCIQSFHWYHSGLSFHHPSSLAHITILGSSLVSWLLSVPTSRPFAMQQPQQSFQYISLLGILQWLPSSLRVKAKLHLIVLWPSFNLDSSYSLHARYTGLYAVPQMYQTCSWSKILPLECSFSALYIPCSLTFQVLA